MDFVLQLLVNGLVVGCVYALAALGFVLIYKASRVLNFAHGDFLAFGTFIAYGLATTTSLPVVPAIFIALGSFFVLGIATERTVLRPLIGKDIVSVIMVTIGLSSVIKGVMYLVWGPGHFLFPEFISDVPIIIGGVYLSPLHLLALATTAVLLTVFSVFFKKSTLGIAMRAVADDQQAALSLGVSIRKIFAVAWGIALMTAVAAGVIVGSITNLSTDGLSVIGILVFPAVIVGGLDSVPGAVIGGLLIGILENLTGGLIDPVIGMSLRSVAPFIVLVLILMIRPYGLFGTVEIERV